MHYRRDIDGLRAIAVGSVVLFHADLTLFGGGFVGVDIFFVISGFLITSIIATEVQQGKFSLVTFYERRVRRIFPALFVMLAATIAISALILLPRDLAEFGRSLVSAALFVSNLFFWRTTDYFGGPAHLKPLLHTWSLSVEEQFYIVFPLIVMAVHRWLGGRLVLWIAPLVVASFSLSIWGAMWKPTAAFYLAPMRAWELLLGALIALGAVPAPRMRSVRELEAAAGLGLIGWSVGTWTDLTVFPGLGALPPCLGAALIIHAGLGGATLVGRLLSAPPMVGLGLISFSLYLWHWPLLSLARYHAGEPLEPAVIAALVGASVVLAALSWRFVELPFRDRAIAATRRPLFATAAAATIAALLVGGLAHAGRGWPERFPGYLELEIAGREQLNEGTCFLSSGMTAASYAGRERCSFGTQDGPRVLVWGDSFAAHLIPGLIQVAPDLTFVQMTASGCPPIIGRHIPNRPECQSINAAALSLIDEIKPAAIIVSARWELYAGRAHVVTDIGASMARIARHGAPVVLVGQGPSFDFDRSTDYVFLKGREVAGSRPTHELNGLLATLRSSAFIDPAALLCERGRCSLVEGGAHLYFDNGHLTPVGSRRVGEVLAPVLRTLIENAGSHRGGLPRAAATVAEPAPSLQKLRDVANPGIARPASSRP